MKKLIHLISLTAILCAASCGGSVPPPDAPDSEKAAKCDKVSQDETLGCKACAGYAFCAWQQTGDATTGTCHFVKDVKSPPSGMIADPTHCPQPK